MQCHIKLSHKSLVVSTKSHDLSREKHGMKVNVKSFKSLTLTEVKSRH